MVLNSRRWWTANGFSGSRSGDRRGRNCELRNEMTGRELEGVSLRLASPFTVRGHVVVEARDGKHGGDPFRFSLFPMAGPLTAISYSNWMLSFSGIF